MIRLAPKPATSIDPSAIVDVPETCLKSPPRWTVVAAITNEPKGPMATLDYRPDNDSKDHNCGD